MFNDFDFRDGVKLAGVNSINFARVLAQVVYYFYSAVALGAPDRKVSFTVPTGNFGDIFAGYIARQMGLPVERLVVATNQNDILHRCLSGQGYHKGDTIPSISPSMDIQVSSNFERALFYAYGQDGGAVAQLMGELATGGFEVSQGAMEALNEAYDSGRCSEDETLATIAGAIRCDRRIAVSALCRWRESRRRRPQRGRGGRGNADGHAGYCASGEIPGCGGKGVGRASASSLAHGGSV